MGAKQGPQGVGLESIGCLSVDSASLVIRKEI